MRIYISGQITGLNLEVATKLFKDAQEKFEAKGYEVVNPMELPHNHAQTWGEYMLEDLAALLTCDSIYMLKDWQRSAGASIEYKFALKLELNFIFE